MVLLVRERRGSEQQQSSVRKERVNGRVVQLVRMPACHAGGRRFEPVPGRQYADVAQPAEQLICNQQVGGSIPSISSITFSTRGSRVAKGGGL